MIVRCKGGWALPGQTPVHTDTRILGEKEPLDRKDTTDGLCPDCSLEMNDPRADIEIKLDGFPVIAGRFGWLEAHARVDWAKRQPGFVSGLLCEVL